jgi:hypothetical protein
MSEANFDFAVEGYFVSPAEAAAFEKLLEKTPEDEQARWKLLGFYFAHMECCPEHIERRIKHIAWAIDNKQESRGGQVFLRLFPPVDEEKIEQIRDSWQSLSEFRLSNTVCNAQSHQKRTNFIELSNDPKITAYSRGEAQE